MEQKHSSSNETTPIKIGKNVQETEMTTTQTFPWGDYFMFVALLSAKRSKDPVTQVGACIVDDENRIVAIGYNGFPRNCHDDDFPWGKSVDAINDKKMYVVHAEANAILNKNSTSIRGMRLYTTLFPCNECTKLIIQSGIGQIFYLSDKYANKSRYKASKRMLDAADVKYERLEPQRWNVKLNFLKIIEADPSSPLKKLKLDKEMEKDKEKDKERQKDKDMDNQTTKIYDDRLYALEPVPEDHQFDSRQHVARTTTTRVEIKQENYELNGIGKRLDYLQWDDYFMGIALLSAKRSKDFENQVGACIVDNEQRVVAIGYNGLPRKCRDIEFLDDKNLFIVHAEANAIMNKNTSNINGMRLYTTLFPCNECTKLIIQSGIKKIYYLTDKYEDEPNYKAAKRMLEAIGIDYIRFKPNWNSVDLSFEIIIRDDHTTPKNPKKLKNS